LFFDESRFGTHSKIGCGWFEKNTRPAVKMKLGYKNFYLYSSVDAKDGSSFSLIMPLVNTEAMSVFLAELSKEYPSDRIALIMDGAGWHKSTDLKVPENIKIFFLPPYSPELNPVERLWLYIKKHTLSNKIYKTIDDLEDALCEFINQLSQEVVKNICTATYLSI
jgi:transposase